MKETNAEYRHFTLTSHRSHQVLKCALRSESPVESIRGHVANLRACPLALAKIWTLSPPSEPAALPEKALARITETWLPTPISLLLLRSLSLTSGAAECDACKWFACIHCSYRYECTLEAHSLVKQYR